MNCVGDFYIHKILTALLLETACFTLHWCLIIGKNVTFVRETESFPFKLRHRVSSWPHGSYGTRLFQSTFLPVKTSVLRGIV